MALATPSPFLIVYADKNPDQSFYLTQADNRLQVFFAFLCEVNCKLDQVNSANLLFDVLIFRQYLGKEFFCGEEVKRGRKRKKNGEGKGEIIWRRQINH